MDRKPSPLFKLAIIGVLLLFFFSREIERIFSVLYAIVLAAIAGMIILHHGANLCKQVTSILWKWGLEFVFEILRGIPHKLVSYVPVEWLRPIVDRWESFLGKVHSITAFVVNDVRQMVIETTVVIMWAFHAIAKWFGWEAQKNDDVQDALSHDPYRWRIIFIVSVKFGRSYDATKTALAELDDVAPFIDWEGNKFDVLPEPSSFVRHFAICAISLEDWNKEGLTLMKKFRSGTFWEIVGADPRPGEGDGVHWKEEKIENIDGVLEIGRIKFDIVDVSKHCFRPLLAAWETYDPIWWNTFDFTARLAYMILQDHQARARIRYFMATIFASRMRKAHQAVSVTFGQYFVMGWWAGVTSWVGGVGLHVFTLATFASLGGPLFVGCWLFTLGSGVSGMWQTSRISATEYPKWQARSDKLAKKLSTLQGLFDDSEGTSSKEDRKQG